MMPRKYFLPLLLALLALAPLAPLALAEPPKTKRLHPELNDDFTDFAVGKTLAELRAKAKPTLVGNEKSPSATWVWISKTNLDTPIITVATPYKTPQGTYAILDAGSEFLYLTYQQPFYREQFKIFASKIPVNPGGSYAAVIAKHPEHGTLFQIGYHFAPLVCGSQEIRLFLLQGRDNKWRFVGEVLGDAMSDVEATAVLTRKIEWTADPKAPVKITLRSDSLADRRDGTLNICTDFTLAGKLPARPQYSGERYIIVPQGATLSGICHEVVGDITDLASPAGKRALKDFKSEVLKLNPGLDPDNINGQKLFVPNWDDGGC